MRRCAFLLACLWPLLSVWAQPAPSLDRAGLQHALTQEVKFRAAAIQVAWTAEALCEVTTEIEPFVLMSVRALGRRLSAADLEVARAAAGIDDEWRVMWVDEGAPDDLKLGDVVIAINERSLPGVGARSGMGLVVQGGTLVTAGEQLEFLEVIVQARAEAKAGKPMVLSMADGKQITVTTQTGCAGSVYASAFDLEPDAFARKGQQVRIPVNAVLAATSADELSWLAAFGTYFLASPATIARIQQRDGRELGFAVGGVLARTGAGAALAKLAKDLPAQRPLSVLSVVGHADLFANELVAAMGGDPEAGLQLSAHMISRNLKAETVLMDATRQANAKEHARRIATLKALMNEREHAANKQAGDGHAGDAKPSATPEPARKP
jgi:hypothetical protein